MAEGAAGPMLFEVEDAPSAEEMEFRMVELYSYVTKRVERFDQCKLDGFIETFRHMEMKYVSTVDICTHGDTKLGILINLFEKYLLCRLPMEHLIDHCDRNAIKFMVECMVSESCDRVQDFIIDDLWKLMIAAHTARTDPSTLVEDDEVTFFGRRFTLNEFLVDVIRKISYFGEFLYFCSLRETEENSPFDSTISACVDKELSMIAELQEKITPELGIATYIIYRNSIADSYPNTSENMSHWINSAITNQQLCNFHDCYLRSFETIERSELLKNYYKRFLIFLGSEASAAHRYFDLYLLRSEDFLDGLRSKKRFMRLAGINRYLIKVMQFFIDVLIYLHDEVENSVCFKKLPKFFTCFWNRSSCPNDYVPSYIFEATQLMDFVFIDKFQNNYTNEFFKICVAISDLIIERFAMPYRREPVLKEYCLFPFFDLKNVRYDLF